MLTQALLFALLPMAVLVLTGIVSVFRTPGPRLRSTLQHFAAGVVFEAAAVEVLPEVRRAQSAFPIIIGFVLGTGLVLTVGQLAKRAEQTEQAEKASPAGLLTTVGIDVLIDGLLIGIGGCRAGRRSDCSSPWRSRWSFSLWDCTLASTLAATGLSRLRVLAGSMLLAVLVLMGAAAGAAVLSTAPDALQVGVLSFGVAALMYLVTEELLVEAHEVTDTTFAAAMFFVGFLLFLVLGLFG